MLRIELDQLMHCFMEILGFADDLPVGRFYQGLSECSASFPEIKETSSAFTYLKEYQDKKPFQFTAFLKTLGIQNIINIFLNDIEYRYSDLVNTTPQNPLSERDANIINVLYSIIADLNPGDALPPEQQTTQAKCDKILAFKYTETNKDLLASNRHFERLFGFFDAKIHAKGLWEILKHRNPPEILPADQQMQTADFYAVKPEDRTKNLNPSKPIYNWAGTRITNSLIATAGPKFTESFFKKPTRFVQGANIEQQKNAYNDHFFRMLLGENVAFIFALGTFSKEYGQGGVRGDFEDYRDMETENFLVKYDEDQHVLTIQEKTGLKREKQISLINIPVKDGEPVDVNQAEFEIIRNVIKEANTNEKILVHCSSGAGRTGNLIQSLLALNNSNMKEVLMNYLEDPTPENLSQFTDALRKIVFHIRSKRYLVQSPSQFYSPVEHQILSLFLNGELEITDTTVSFDMLSEKLREARSFVINELKIKNKIQGKLHSLAQCEKLSNKDYLEISEAIEKLYATKNLEDYILQFIPLIHCIKNKMQNRDEATTQILQSLYNSILNLPEEILSIQPKSESPNQAAVRLIELVSIYRTIEKIGAQFDIQNLFELLKEETIDLSVLEKLAFDTYKLSLQTSNNESRGHVKNLVVLHQVLIEKTISTLLSLLNDDTKNELLIALGQHFTPYENTLEMLEKNLVALCDGSCKAEKDFSAFNVLINIATRNGTIIPDSMVELYSGLQIVIQKLQISIHEETLSIKIPKRLLEHKQVEENSRENQLKIERIMELSKSINFESLIYSNRESRERILKLAEGLIILIKEFLQSSAETIDLKTATKLNELALHIISNILERFPEYKPEDLDSDKKFFGDYVILINAQREYNDFYKLNPPQLNAEDKKINYLSLVDPDSLNFWTETFDILENLYALTQTLQVARASENERTPPTKDQIRSHYKLSVFILNQIQDLRAKLRLPEESAEMKRLDDYRKTAIEIQYEAIYAIQDVFTFSAETNKSINETLIGTITTGLVTRLSRTLLLPDLLTWMDEEFNASLKDFTNTPFLNIQTDVSNSTFLHAKDRIQLLLNRLEAIVQFYKKLMTIELPENDANRAAFLKQKEAITQSLNHYQSFLDKYKSLMSIKQAWDEKKVINDKTPSQEFMQLHEKYTQEVIWIFFASIDTTDSLTLLNLENILISSDFSKNKELSYDKLTQRDNATLKNDLQNVFNKLLSGTMHFDDERALLEKLKKFATRIPELQEKITLLSQIRRERNKTAVELKRHQATQEALNPILEFLLIKNKATPISHMNFEVLIFGSAEARKNLFLDAQKFLRHSLNIDSLNLALENTSKLKKWVSSMRESMQWCEKILGLTQFITDEKEKEELNQLLAQHKRILEQTKKIVSLVENIVSREDALSKLYKNDKCEEDRISKLQLLINLYSALYEELGIDGLAISSLSASLLSPIGINIKEKISLYQVNLASEKSVFDKINRYQSQINAVSSSIDTYANTLKENFETRVSLQMLFAFSNQEKFENFKKLHGILKNLREKLENLTAPEFQDERTLERFKKILALGKIFRKISKTVLSELETAIKDEEKVVFQKDLSHLKSLFKKIDGIIKFQEIHAAPLRNLKSSLDFLALVSTNVEAREKFSSDLKALCAEIKTQLSNNSLSESNLLALLKFSNAVIALPEALNLNDAEKTAYMAAINENQFSEFMKAHEEIHQLHAAFTKNIKLPNIITLEQPENLIPTLPEVFSNTRIDLNNLINLIQKQMFEIGAKNPEDFAKLVDTAELVIKIADKRKNLYPSLEEISEEHRKFVSVLHNLIHFKEIGDEAVSREKAANPIEDPQIRESHDGFTRKRKYNEIEAAYEKVLCTQFQKVDSLTLLQAIVEKAKTFLPATYKKPHVYYFSDCIQFLKLLTEIDPKNKDKNLDLGHLSGKPCSIKSMISFMTPLVELSDAGTKVKRYTLSETDQNPFRQLVKKIAQSKSKFTSSALALHGRYSETLLYIQDQLSEMHFIAITFETEKGLEKLNTHIGNLKKYIDEYLELPESIDDYEFTYDLIQCGKLSLKLFEINILENKHNEDVTSILETLSASLTEYQEYFNQFNNLVAIHNAFVELTKPLEKLNLDIKFGDRKSVIFNSITENAKNLNWFGLLSDNLEIRNLMLANLNQVLRAIEEQIYITELSDISTIPSLIAIVNFIEKLPERLKLSLSQSKELNSTIKSIRDFSSKHQDIAHSENHLEKSRDLIKLILNSLDFVEKYSLLILIDPDKNTLHVDDSNTVYKQLKAALKNLTIVQFSKIQSRINDVVGNPSLEAKLRLLATFNQRKAESKIAAMRSFFTELHNLLQANSANTYVVQNIQFHLNRVCKRALDPKTELMQNPVEILQIIQGCLLPKLENNSPYKNLLAAFVEKHTTQFPHQPLTEARAERITSLLAPASGTTTQMGQQGHFKGARQSVAPDAQRIQELDESISALLIT